MSSYFWFVSMVGDEEGRRVDSDEVGVGVGSFYLLSSKLRYYDVRGC